MRLGFDSDLVQRRRSFLAVTRMIRYYFFIPLLLTLKTFGLTAQSAFADITFKWEISLNAKSSYLQLNDLNDQLVSAGYLPFDDYTEEINFCVNTHPSLLPFGFSMSYSNGGAANVPIDKKSYSNIRVSYLGIAIFKELEYKRFAARGFITYETGSYRGDFYTKYPSSNPLTSYSGSTILNNSKGVKPSVQLLFSIGKKRLNSLGVEGSYFYRLNQLGWKIYPTGPPTNLPDLKNGERAFSFVFLHKFYKPKNATLPENR